MELNTFLCISGKITFYIFPWTCFHNDALQLGYLIDCGRLLHAELLLQWKSKDFLSHLITIYTPGLCAIMKEMSWCRSIIETFPVFTKEKYMILDCNKFFFMKWEEKFVIGLSFSINICYSKGWRFSMWSVESNMDKILSIWRKH